MKYIQLNSVNYFYFALKYYENENANWTNFMSDLRIFSHISKYLLSRQNATSGQVSIKNILNNIIYLGNMFPNDSLSRLLFFICKPETHSELKTVLEYIGRCPLYIPETDIHKISLSDRVSKELSEIF